MSNPTTKKSKFDFKQYPKSFWVLIIASFIDGVGGAMMFPFFSLYITDAFNVGVTEVGIIFSLYSIGSIGGNLLGGAAADKFGRRLIILIGITASGLSSLLMIFIHDLTVFYILAFLLGTVGSIGQPAQQAMVSDILPPELRADGFGILRIAGNLTVAIGPFLATIVLALNTADLGIPFLAQNAYALLFIADAVSSIITAIIIVFTIPETKPESTKNEKETSFKETLKGYFEVLKDRLFILLVILSAFVSLVAMQMSSTLSIFLRDIHAFDAQHFGYLLSMNAAMVVILQFPITRLTSKRSPVVMLAIGALLFGLGFGMYGFVDAPVYFFIAMIIVTFGEMITSPFSQSLVATFAPEDKRGRYMAIHGFSWMIPSIFGIILAGIIMDNYNPNLVWIFGAIICFLTALGYLATLKKTKKRLSSQMIEEEETIEALQIIK